VCGKKRRSRRRFDHGKKPRHGMVLVGHAGHYSRSSIKLGGGKVSVIVMEVEQEEAPQ
jgi:hypothetical protein